jgi:glycerol kinase
MVANDWLMQRLADLNGCIVERPVVAETTALGAAALAGLGVGLIGGLEEISRTWRSAGRFAPVMAGEERDRHYAGWQDAVARVRSGT